MVKIKHRRTVDCVVGGFREHKDGGKIGSLLLGVFDNEQLHFIGHCSGFPDGQRVEIYERFLELVADDSFDKDARAPGAQSRWSSSEKDSSWTPVQPGVVVEVSYDQLEGHRFRHATRFHRWRPDKDPKSCTMDQLERPEGPGFAEVVK
jgi:ATP-dependent DNA ligase